MARYATKPDVDSVVFSKTATNHKKINIKPTTRRGGIRL